MPQPTPDKIQKAPSGIAGLDSVTGGGLPRGRCTLVCGGPGCGKTLFGMQFLVKGFQDHGESGVFVSFEETLPELSQNVASLGFDLGSMAQDKQVIVDHVEIAPESLREAGEFTLDGLFIRLEQAINRVRAKRVVLDTIESLFDALPGRSTLVRAELRRLFRWLKDQGVTAVITAERGSGSLTRNGLEEYVSDCVILLDQRIAQEAVTRRLHIVKYRGSPHSSNEFPFVIDEGGFSVVPITSSRLDQPAPTEHISTGIPDVDRMLGGKGPYRASSILVSGTAGTGKSTFAASFLDAACRRGERAMYFSFEESPATLIRDFRQVGIDLGTWQERGLLEFQCSRVTATGLEMHIALMTRAIRKFRPTVAVIDPVSAFDTIASPQEAKNMTTLLADMLRREGVTAVVTYLAHGGEPLEATTIGISSSVDVWIVLRDTERAGERQRKMHILKARGMANSNRLHRYWITSKGIAFHAPGRARGKRT